MNLSIAKMLFMFGFIMTSFSGNASVYPRTVQVQLFEWPWKDIALECEQYLGPAGVAAVQVSPPQDHAILPGRPWYERYQPVSYDIISRSGDEQDFTEMVNRCKRAGVDIYVDAVINHMTWIPPQGQMRYGISKQNYSYYSIPEKYSGINFIEHR